MEIQSVMYACVTGSKMCSVQFAKMSGLSFSSSINTIEKYDESLSCIKVMPCHCIRFWHQFT